MELTLSLTTKQTVFIDALFFDDCKNIRTDNEYTEFYSVGGFGSGKSRIVYTATDWICENYKNCHGVFIRETFPELKDSVIPQFMSYFPEDRHKYKFYESDRIAEFKNGTRLDFRAFDKDSKILSNEYDFIVYSQIEEIKEELFLAALGRNRRRIGGLPKNIILGEGNPAANWVKTRLKDKKPSNVFVVESKTRDNPNLPKGYEENLRKNYPKFWIDRYLDGEWSNLEELVFSEFKESENVCEIVDPQTIHSDYIRRNGLDWGWVNPSANLWGYVDYDGILTIYDEYYQNKTLPEDVAKECLKHGKIWTVADHAMKGLKMPVKEFEDRTVWSELERFGMNLIPCNKEELSNIVLVNTLFKAKKIKITRNCVNLIREIKNWKWKRIKLGADKNQFEEPVDKDNHACDALDYMVAELFGQEAKDSAKEKLFNDSLYKIVIQKDRFENNMLS